MLIRAYFRLMRARLEREKELEEAFDRYVKSIEPLVLLFWRLCVVPKIIADLEDHYKSADEHTDRN
jgi:hypothetical protein